MRLWLDKIGSATANVPLRRDARVSPQIVAREGHIVAGRVRGEKTVYNTLEDVHGRLTVLHDGDVIACVLGRRNALHGYSGRVPETVQPGDVLQLLNLGGVVGKCDSQNPDVGPPFNVEVLGSILVFPQFEDRSGVSAHIGMNAIPPDGEPNPDIPVVYVAGTCMNSGKTSAACRLIRELSKRGRRIGACKLTGVSLRRDTLQMADYGAQVSASFTEAGVVCTTPDNAAPVAWRLFAHLAHHDVDVIIAELGDGILGEYGVARILADQDLMPLTGAIVMCANDPVGAWGAQRVMREQFDLPIDVISGPATDNAVGTRYITEQLRIEAINARTDGARLGEFVAARLATRGAEVPA